MNNSLLLRRVNPSAKGFWTFENTLLDKTKNQYTCSSIGGNVPFNVKNTYAGDFGVGPITDGLFPSLPNSFISGIQNPASQFQLGEMYFYCNDISNQPVIWSNPFNASDHFQQVLVGGAIKTYWAGANTQSAGGVISAGKWYYFAWCTDCRIVGNSLEKIWVCEATKIPANLYNNPTATSTPGVFGSTQIGLLGMNYWQIGRYYSVAGYALNGYIKNVKFTNTVPTQLPLVD